jgi:hypothetical protein
MRDADTPMQPGGTVYGIKDGVPVMGAKVLRKAASGVLVRVQVAEKPVANMGMQADDKADFGETTVHIDPGIVLTSVENWVRLRLNFHKRPLGAVSL